MTRHSNALFYCSHPDIHPSVPSGYATHIKGVIDGLAHHGVSTSMCLAGHPAAEQRPPEQGQRDSGRVTSASGLRGSIRAAVPMPLWNTLRDIRLAAFDRRTASQLSSRLQQPELRPDFVYERFTHLHHLGPRVTVSAGLPHVLEVNSPPSERADLGGRSLLDPFARQRARSAVLETSVGVFVSSALRESYRELCDDPLDHTIVIPNGIDADRTVDSALSAGDDGTVVIGFTGSLLAWHGLDLMLEAYAACHQESVASRFVIVGDGSERDRLEQLVVDLGIAERVEFTGALTHDEALSWTQRFDIAVMAKSNWYGSPTKLAEYASAGCAIIAPDTDPVRDVFTHEVDALICKPDVTELIGALNRLLVEPDLRSRLGENAKATIEQSLTWPKLVEKMLQKLEEVTRP